MLWAKPHMEKCHWVNLSQKLDDLKICCYNFDVSDVVPVLPKARYMLLNVRNKPLDVQAAAQLFVDPYNLEYVEIFLKTCPAKHLEQFLDLVGKVGLQVSQRHDNGVEHGPQCIILNHRRGLSTAANSAMLGVQCWTLNLEMHNCKMKLRSILGE